MIKSKVENIKLGYREFNLEVITNIDELLANVKTEEDIPFWAELWPASLGLSEILCREEMKDKRLLELGAGLGLPGIVASKLGAQVLQTDYKTEALEWAEKNSGHNGITNIKYSLLDWRNPNFLGQFDYIIGSDILYEPNLYNDLYKTIEINIKETGKIFISDPGRAYAIEFLQLLNEKGWSWEEDRLKVDTGSGSKLINLYRIKKN